MVMISQADGAQAEGAAVDGRVISRIERMCIERGLKMTGQRRTIARVLSDSEDHPDVEELYRRAQLLEVTLGGEMRVEGRIAPEHAAAERRTREIQGIGTEDEDIGEMSDETYAVDLPAEMIERLRVDLSVWKPTPN